MKNGRKRNKWPSGQRDDNSETLHATFQDFFGHIPDCAMHSAACVLNESKVSTTTEKNKHSSENNDDDARLRHCSKNIQVTIIIVTMTRSPRTAQSVIIFAVLFFSYFSWSKLCLNRFNNSFDVVARRHCVRTKKSMPATLASSYSELRTHAVTEESVHKNTYFRHKNEGARAHINKFRFGRQFKLDNLHATNLRWE